MTKTIRAERELKGELAQRGWDVFYVWLIHKRQQAGELTKVYAKDSFSAHLYAQHYWGEDFLIQLVGEPEGEEVERDG